MAILSTLYQNLSSVLLALLLALLVWMTAANISLERITNYPRSQAGIPIKLINIPPDLVVAESNLLNVHVDVRISKELADVLQPSDILAQADLEGLEAGEHTIAVEVESQPFAPPLQLLKTTPDRISISLDNVVTRTFPIESEITDRTSLPQTLQVLTTTVEPPSITLTGPATLLEPIVQVIAEVQLKGARESFSDEVEPKLITIDQEVLDISRFTSSANNVSIGIEIGVRPGYRELLVRTDIEGEPTRGYWVSAVSVEPPTVTVVGQPSIISALDSIVNTETIDVAGWDKSQVIKGVRLQLPEGVSTLRDVSVQVTIDIESQTSSKQLSVAPIVTGLAPGFVVPNDGIIPNTVNVLLKGSVAELEQTTPNDVVVTLDATERGAGVHLLVPQIQAPGTLESESVNPEKVEVTIEEEEIQQALTLPIEPIGLAGERAALLDPTMLDITLEGPFSLLGALSPTDLQLFVELTDLVTGSYELESTLPLNPEITLVTPLPMIDVTIYEESDLVSASQQVTLVNLPSDLQATLSQSVILVRTLGPGDSETLKENPNFKVEVDVAELTEGTYTLRPQVSLPASYRLVDTVPLKLEIGLQKKEE